MARGWFTRDELIVVCKWKTDRSKGLVARNTEGDVKLVTGEALAAADEAARMAKMKGLWGVGVPTASVLLFSAFPSAYPIIDERALESLGQAKPSYYSVDLWVAYLDVCRKLAAELDVPIRTFDKALWQASVERVGREPCVY